MTAESGKSTRPHAVAATGRGVAAGKADHAAAERATSKTASAEADLAHAPHVADRVKAEAMRANMSAIATADVGDLQMTGSALGIATVADDAEMTTSAAGLVSVGGDATIHQAVAWGVFGKGAVSVEQGGSALVLAREYDVQSGVAGVVVATEATVSRGWIGFLLAPRATLSDDSRVLIGTVPALIIGAAIVAGFGVLAFVGLSAARSALAWRPKLPRVRWE